MGAAWSAVWLGHMLPSPCGAVIPPLLRLISPRVLMFRLMQQLGAWVRETLLLRMRRRSQGS